MDAFDSKFGSFVLFNFVLQQLQPTVMLPAVVEMVALLVDYCRCVDHMGCESESSFGNGISSCDSGHGYYSNRCDCCSSDFDYCGNRDWSHGWTDCLDENNNILKLINNEITKKWIWIRTTSIVVVIVEESSVIVILIADTAMSASATWTASRSGVATTARWVASRTMPATVATWSTSRTWIFETKQVD